MPSIGPTPIHVQARDLHGNQASFRAHILGNDGQKRALSADAVQRLTPEIQAFIEHLIAQNSKEVNRAVNSPGKALQLTRYSVTVAAAGSGIPEITNLTNALSWQVLASIDYYQGKLTDALYPERSHLPNFNTLAADPTQRPLSPQRSPATSSDSEAETGPTPARQRSSRPRLRRRRRDSEAFSSLTPPMRPQGPPRTLLNPHEETSSPPSSGSNQGSFIEFGFLENQDLSSSDE